MVFSQTPSPSPSPLPEHRHAVTIRVRIYSVNRFACSSLRDGTAHDQRRRGHPVRAVVRGVLRDAFGGRLDRRQLSRWVPSQCGEKRLQLWRSVCSCSIPLPPAAVVVRGILGSCSTMLRTIVRTGSTYCSSTLESVIAVYQVEQLFLRC